MVGINKTERVTELCEIIDDTLNIIQSTGTIVMLVPKLNPNGKAVRQISSKKYTNGEANHGVTWRQSSTLLDIKVYTNDWVTRPSKWDTSTIQVSIMTSKQIDHVYYNTAIPLLSKGIELFPWRRHVKKVDNLPIGGILLSFNSLDHRALSFTVLVKRGDEGTTEANGKQTCCNTTCNSKSSACSKNK